MNTQLNQNQLSEKTANRLIDVLKKAPIQTASKSTHIAKQPLIHLRNSQIAAGITATIGLVFFAFGIENLISTIPALASPYVEIAFGLFLLSISGLFLKKLF